jgi:hypothetical protein
LRHLRLCVVALASSAHEWLLQRLAAVIAQRGIAVALARCVLRPWHLVPQGTLVNGQPFKGLMPRLLHELTMLEWEELRRRARTLEADIDAKLIAFNRLSVAQVRAGRRPRCCAPPLPRLPAALCLWR